MPFKRRRSDLCLTNEERKELEKLRVSRTAEKRKVVRASILLDSFAGLSDRAVAAKNRVDRNTVGQVVRKCLELGVGATLIDLRPGRAPVIGDDAKTWVRDLACRKPAELGIRASCGHIVF